MKKLVSLLLALALCLGLAVPALAADLASEGHTETLSTPIGKAVTITNVLRVEKRTVAEYEDKHHLLTIYIVSNSGAKASIQENAVGGWTDTQVWDRKDECFHDPAQEDHVFITDSHTLEIPSSRPDGEVLLFNYCGIGIMREEDFDALTPKTFSGPTGFFDVGMDDYFFDPVLWAVENGVTKGTSKTGFSPSQTCTQGQILTFLWRAKGEPKPAGAAGGTAYYAKAAQWAREQGLIDGIFAPDAPCTRLMVVTYLWKLAGSPAASGAGSTDVPARDAQAVAWAVEQGVTKGTGAGKFSPDTTCTRGEIVTFLYRALAK